MEKSLMNILIIEDIEAVAASLGAVLGAEGYKKVNFVGSAEEAFAFLGLDENTPPGDEVDLVLMDIMLPGIDGIDACRHVKSFKQFEDLPIIMVTASESSEDLYQAFEAGAVDFIVKPVKKLELLARVNSIMRLKHEMDRRKLWEKKLLETTVQLNEAKQALKKLESRENNHQCVNDNRSFNEVFRGEWELAAQKESPISLLMINIDCFAKHGELCSPELEENCMGRFTEALCEAMKQKRPGDFMARYGCDDFVVVLPTTDVSGALKVAEKIHSQLKMVTIDKANGAGPTKLAVSIGVASAMPSKQSSTKILIAAADEALYMAKKEGGSRIRLAQD